MKMKRYYSIFKISTTITFLTILSGCAAVTGHKGAMNNFDASLESNKCDFAMVDEKIKDDNDTILWGIQGGSLARNCMDYKKSITLFDKAEQKYKEDVDKDNVANNALESSASVLVNNNVNDYEGNTYEKVMVNTYKALDFASLNDHQNARVEFNRALDRQRRAKEFYESEIKDKKEELSKKKAEDKTAKKKTEAIDTMKAAENSKTQDAIYKKYNSLLNDFDAYPDFVNPFTTYISGIYFMLNGDGAKARDLLKESLSMAPKNKQILSDFKLSDKYVSSLRHSKNNYIWVIYENGHGMVKDELRIDIPLFIFTSKVYYTGIALPKIVEKNPSYAYLNVEGKNTIEVCNMDNVIKTEFKKRFPLIVTEAVLNTVVKTIAQQQLTDKGGLIGGLAGALYQGLTNKADVRSWTALPKNFQSVRVKNTGKPLEIKTDKGEVIKTILLPKDKNAMVYVRSQNFGNDKVHEIIF